MADNMGRHVGFCGQKTVDKLGLSGKGTLLDLDDRLLLRHFFRGLNKDTDIRVLLST
jgi:hypothetical protein